MIRIDGLLCSTVRRQRRPSSELRCDVAPRRESSDVTDNMRVKPASAHRRSIVSDTPIGVVALEPDRQGNATPSITGYQKLLQIQNTKKLVQIISDKYGTFDDMALTSLTAPFTKDTGKSLMFTAVFEMFVIVENNRTVVPTAVRKPAACRTSSRAKQCSGAGAFPDRIYVTVGPR